MAVTKNYLSAAYCQQVNGKILKKRVWKWSTGKIDKNVNRL